MEIPTPAFSFLASPFGIQDLSSPARGRTRLPCSGSRRAPPAELPGSPTHSPATSPVFSSQRGPLTMSPFLGQARPFCTNFPWFCRFFGPPSANLQSKGSDGAAEREKADRQLGPTSLSPFTHAKSLQNPHRSHSLWPLSLIPRCLTWYSRGCLNIFSIKVGDDGFTLLCGLHPKEHRRG